MEKAGFKPGEPGDRPMSDAIKALSQTIKRRLLRRWQRKGSLERAS
jgi:hypothetical protein